MAFNIPLSSLSPTDSNVVYTNSTILKVGGSGNITVSSTLVELNGNVGIGSSVPVYPLDISGDIRSTGNLTVAGNLTVNGSSLGATTFAQLNSLINLSLMGYA